MKLLIRNQDKEILKISNDIIEIRFIKNNICYDDGWAIFIDKTIMGVYETKKRALEVLDEICSLIKNQFIVECHPLLKKSDIELIRQDLENQYDGEFIMQPSEFTFHPINEGTIYYEMPKE